MNRSMPKKNILIWYYQIRFASSKQENLYDVLGVKRTASVKEIKAAYYKKCKEYHPDNNKDPKSHNKFIIINKAYSILSSAASKRQYDSSLYQSAQSSSSHYTYPNPYMHPSYNDRSNYQWRDIEYERYMRYKQEREAFTNANSKQDALNFNSPLRVMLGLIFFLGAFEIFMVTKIYDSDDIHLSNRHNPFHKSSQYELKKQLSNLNESEIDELIRKNKEYSPSQRLYDMNDKASKSSSKQTSE